MNKPEQALNYGFAEVFRKKRGAFFFGAIFILGAVLLIKALTLYMVPRTYLGKVRLEIEPYPMAFQVFPGNGTLSSYDPNTFMETETLTLGSKETFYRLIDDLDLVKRWHDAKTRADAFAMLNQRVTIIGHPGTRLVDIVVRHHECDEAAAIANGIARAYRERRNSIDSSRALAGLDTLNAQETLQSQKVEDARLKMVELQEKFAIVDITPGGKPPSREFFDTGKPAQVMAVKMETQKAEQELSKLAAWARALSALDREQTLATLLFENSGLLPATVQQHINKRDTLKAREAVLVAGGIEADAPERVVLRAEIDYYEKALDASADDARRVLTFRLKTSEKTLQNLRTMEDYVEAEQMNERKTYVQYAEAKRNYEQQSAILETMTNELLREKVDLTMPRDPITAHEIAEPNLASALPDVAAELMSSLWLGLVLCLPGGLCFMYLSYAFSSGAASSKRPPFERPLEPIGVEADPWEGSPTT